MNYRLLFLGSAVLVSFVLAGCGSDSSSGTENPAPSDAASDSTGDALLPEGGDAQPADGGDAQALDAKDAQAEDSASSDAPLPDATGEDAPPAEGGPDAAFDGAAPDAQDAAQDGSADGSLDGATDGATDGAANDGQAQCADALKRCAHVFSYPVGTETSVEVRGTFAPNGWTQGVAMQPVGGFWTVSIDLAWGTDVQYKYVVNGSQWVVDPANPDKVSDGYGGFNSVVKNVSCASWSCAQPPPENDWQNAVMYFAFVDRFVDGNPANNGSQTSGVSLPADYQGGDYAGLAGKVTAGYFNDLGVNTLWLTVPVDNTDSSGIGSDGHNYAGYHGYWPKSLEQTEERFGTMAELKALVDAAHAKGIRVVLDYAMNHVHQDAPVYAQHPDWFWPKDVNGQACICGSSVCPWDGSMAKRCWFTDYLPDFNFTNAIARNYSVDNVIWWMQQTGADGLRLDAVKHIEDSWLTDLRARLTTDIEPVTQHHVYLVGETYTGDRNLIKYYVNGAMLDGQFDFPLRAQMIASLLLRSAPMSDLAGFLDSNDSFYGSSAVMSTFVGNHDVPRSIHFAQDNPAWTDAWAGGKERAWSNQPGLPSEISAFERLGNAYTLLFTTQGVPLIYYGDEVGMPGAGDPDNRRMMQWTGYTQGQQALLAHVKKLGQLRASLPALRQGTRTTLSSNADTFAYKRTAGAQTVYVAINRSDSAQSVSNLPSSAMTDQLTQTSFTGPTVTVPSRSALILTAP